MATTAQARTPVHLWVVGVLAFLWNCFGCVDYTMTNIKNPAWLANMPADQLAYMATLPSWLTGFWAIGVWGGLVGAILLLVRSRYAVWAFGLSFVGAIVGLGYQLAMTTMPASMKQGMMVAVPYVIIVITAFLFWYAWNAEKKGLLG